MRLRDKVAVVTGGGSGIGEAICLKFVEHGARILVADVDAKRAARVTEQIGSLGGEALAFNVDVASYGQVADLIRNTVTKFGTIDVLVNSAGIGRFVPTEELTEDDWTRTIDVNLSGTFHCCLLAGKEMMKTKKGKIINISSMAGLAGIPNSAPYVASKHGVVGLTKALAIDFAKYKINVNCICPGTTLTPLNREIMSEEYMASRARQVPLGGLADPEDHANAALYLASSESDYVTGLIMHVDGGMYSLFSGYAGQRPIS